VSESVTVAEQALDARDFSKAEALLTKVVDAEGKQDARAWFDLGFTESALHRPAQAVSAYQRAVALFPASFESHMNLGLALASTGNTLEAARELKMATTLTPQSRPPGPKLAIAWLAFGEVTSSQDSEAAMGAFRKAEALDPANIEPHLDAGALAAKTGDAHTAKAEYLAALELQPASADALTGLANVYIAAKRPAEAIDSLRKLLALDATNTHARLQLARALQQSGDIKGAIATLEAASKPPSFEISRDLSTLYIDAKQYDKAIPLLQRIVTASPQDWRARQQLGVLLLQSKSFAEAEKQLAMAADLHAGDAELYANLAASANGAGDYPTVLQALTARSTIAAETPGTLFFRAIALDHLGQYENATEMYKKFLAASDGKFPEEEWQARHRLPVVEKMKR